MISSFQVLCEELTEAIRNSYEQGITMDEAEKLAGKFLYAQIQASDELRAADLDARLKKTGTKAVKAAVYLAEATRTEKKPSDVMLQAQVEMNELVASEQRGQDEAEVKRDHLQNYMNIFRDGHIHFRTVSKGRFE